SMLARKEERRLKTLLQQCRSLDDAGAAELERALEALEVAARGVILPSPTPVGIAPSPDCRAPDTPARVFLLDPIAARAADMAQRIAGFGYRVETFDDVGEMRRIMATRPPCVILAPMGPDGQLDADLAPLCHEQRDHAFALVFIADDARMTTRLAAVRAGGVAFFTRPLAMGRLIEELDALTHRDQAAPYRVLIIDDDADLAAHYGAVLQQAGMDARHLPAPMELLPAMDEFRPDLLLLDLYMPECTGVELARLIRQDDAYLGIPIIFLSSETGADAQFHALSQGADGFLTKPIDDEDLVKAVIARAERTRAVSSQLARDSLTGLLNHSTSKETIAAEFARARRQDAAMSCVMIDIDHFKQVNDRYGHMAGDQVIASLTRLLQQRLRHSDIVGRYGGEEFIVLMPGTPPETASRIIDELRARFALSLHHAGGTDFDVTFSAGLSAAAPYDTADAMIAAADDALYRAKQQGRNRVATV
ncbi:MAG TPA: diguanylate cyclase, partial [Thioalkalivibrio sp.]|nr:diguanylate cyclase [Thioalkalivibrio sp.]